MLALKEGFPRGLDGDIEQRLNPNLWSGHTLGQGDLEPRPTIPFPSPGITDTFGAKGVLRAPGALRLPLGKFGLGDFFSADEHEPGTFLLYHKELLEGRPLSEAEIQKYSQFPTPNLPRTENPGATSDASKLPVEFYEYSEGDGRTYVSMIYAGVVREVGRHGQRRKALIGLPLLGGFRSSEPQSSEGSEPVSMVFYTGPPQIEPNSIDIGMPMHFLESVRGEEAIQRINMLELHIDGAGENVGPLAIEHSTSISLV